MEFKRICICGSMRFYPEMLRQAERLTIEGYIVLMPYASKTAIAHRIQETEEMLDHMHIEKIDMCEEVLIVDCDSTLENVYIGFSTRSEIAHAKASQKRVTYRSELSR